jgi:hypothetical protein
MNRKNVEHIFEKNTEVYEQNTEKLTEIRQKAHML